MYTLNIKMTRLNTETQFFDYTNTEVLNYISAVATCNHTKKLTKSADTLSLDLTITLADEQALDEFNAILDEYADVRLHEIQRRSEAGIVTELTVDPLIRY